MTIRRGIEGAGIVARKAYAAYGWEATPEVIDAFYATFRGRRFKQALAAVERCFQHPGRAKPPTCSEVFAEYQAIDREIERDMQSERTLRQYSEGRALTPVVFHRQVVAAKAKHPHLFDKSSGFDMNGLVESINAMLRQEKPIELPKEPPPARYQPELDPWEKQIAATEYGYDDEIPF